MFGYIRAYKPELRVREWELYKAVYCSLCKRLGKNFGIAARFTLSYDFVFLAMLKMSMQDGFGGTERKRCAFNPLKKCNYCIGCDDDLDFSSNAAMIMLYFKITDNIRDEKGFKKLKYKLAKRLFSRPYKKSAKACPQIEKAVEDYIAQQNELEDSGCNIIDMAAEPTAKVLSEIFSMCSENERDKTVLSRLGYCIGRYIYILDATSDYEKDKKSNSYNPYILAGVSGAEVRERAKMQLYNCINEAGKAFELLNIYKMKNILGNIIYLGLEDTFKKEISNEQSV